MERPIMDRNIFNTLFKFVDNVIKRFDRKMIRVRVYRKNTHTHTHIQGTIRLFIIHIFIRMRNCIYLFYFIFNVF